MTLTEHIAIMDLLALARVVLLPEDDLSLAALLKSPLIGLDEDALFDLAVGRGGSAVGGAARQGEGAPFAAPVRDRSLARRRRQRDPHGFFARILGPDRRPARFPPPPRPRGRRRARRIPGADAGL